jgi:serine/threonine protein phosphatase PrpC
MTDPTELRCAACQALVAPGDLFCEGCGARLADGETEDDGGPNGRIELDLTIAAAVTDRGRVHSRNEDAFQLSVDRHGWVAAVICDGISSASAGNVAARRAAAAAADVLRAALADPARDSNAASLDAVSAAHGAVARVPWTTRTDRAMPSCTLVLALCRGQEVVVASVGDSRAYWIDSQETRRLTVDDSWAEEQVADGLLTVDQAAMDPRAHSITHWIGADAPDRAPPLTTFSAARPGRLLLCTDGLWNYLTSPAELGELVDTLPTGASAAAVARALTDTAIARGGRDNVTVAVVDIARGMEDAR